MERRTQRPQRTRVVRAGFLLAGLLSGCCWDQHCCDSPVPPPAGTLTHAILHVQAQKAEADDFVIHNNEWYLGGTALGPYGEYHLNQIAHRLPTVPYPVVIQPEANRALTLTRQGHIINCLREQGVADAAERVVIAFPQAEGLFGECESERAFIRMLHPAYFPGVYNDGAGLYGAPSAGVTGYNGFGAFRGY